MGSPNSQGSQGGIVATNVRALRQKRGYSLNDLSERMTLTSRPILSTGLHRLERGQRRVDVDDLVALAAALDVSVTTLLRSAPQCGDCSDAPPKGYACSTCGRAFVGQDGATDGSF